MNILTINCGSSTIKCALFDSPTQKKPIWEISETNHKKNTLKEIILSLPPDTLSQIKVVGHRIVHGGTDFEKSTLITKEVKEKIKRSSNLAPLHNAFEIEAIDMIEELLPKTPQIAVFDTTFHRTLPKSAKIYPGPLDWFEEGIQRFGFHGTSFQYCSKECAKILNLDLKKTKMVICHLGSGASLCAVKGGQSIDTTMGFTPLEGLMMDTRSGSIDPGIVLHLLEKTKKSLKELSDDLYLKSGLLGIFGKSSDMREVIKESEKKDPKALLALDIYLHRLNASIASMISSLQGLDALVFTAGIGENAPLIRERVCNHFAFLGLKIDTKKNNAPSQIDRVISLPDSKAKIVVIHTNEAFEIASECLKIIQ